MSDLDLPTHIVICNPNGGKIEWERDKENQLEMDQYREEMEDRPRKKLKPTPPWKGSIVGLFSSRDAAELFVEKHINDYAYGLIICALEELYTPVVTTKRTNLVKPREEINLEVGTEESHAYNY